MKKPEIIIYTLPTCGFCQLAKAYFKDSGLKFREVNVDKDPSAQKEMVKKSGQFTVPVIEVGGKIVVGFQKQALDVLLAL